MGCAATTLTLWTSDPLVARAADAAGVDRIGVDLETRGKRMRQAGLDSWISPHDVDDLRAVAGEVRRGAVFARLDPLHDGWDDELEAVIAAGAVVVMLPMFRTADDLRRCVDAVAGRASVVALLETQDALRAIEAVVAVEGVDELHVGINDLGLALGLRSRFGVLTLPAVAQAAAATRAAGLRFGIGGIGRACEAGARVPTDLVFAQLVRLRADATLLARSFLRGNHLLAADVQAARARLAWWSERPSAELDAAWAELRDLVARPGMCF